MKNSLQILILSFFSVLNRSARALEQSSSGFLTGGSVMGFRKIIVAHVLVGFLSVPVQLFGAAPPPLPPHIAAENIEKVENFEKFEKVENCEKAEQAVSPELERREESSVSRETPQSETEAPSRIPAALSQTGVGLVGGLGSALAGLLLGSIVCGKGSNPAGIPSPSGCGVVAALAGYLVGTSVSVWRFGEVMGWDGSLLATFAGLAVGVVASIGFPPLALAFMPAGATFGYHLSADWPTSSGMTAMPGAVGMPKVTSIPIVSFEF